MRTEGNWAFGIGFFIWFVLIITAFFVRNSVDLWILFFLANFGSYFVGSGFAIWAFGKDEMRQKREP